MKTQQCPKSPDKFHHDKSTHNAKWNDMTVKLFNDIEEWFMPENYDGYHEKAGLCIFCSEKFSKNI